MPSIDSSVKALTIQDLVDLCRDPRPSAAYRALSGFDTDRLIALGSRLEAALPSIGDFSTDLHGKTYREDMVTLKTVVRSILSRRFLSEAGERLLAEAA